ncbi:MAG: hypothetical protein ABIV94_04640 [Acidimicrobiales bacterium]
MSRRIDVELTSGRDDGSFTWRAAGAKQPKGVVAGDLLPATAKVGDVLRAEADLDLEGVTITAILPPLVKHRNEAKRIELVGPPPRDDEPLVTSTLVPKERGSRPDRSRREGGDRPPRSGGPRPDGERRERRGREGDGAAPKGDRRPPRPRPEAPARPKPKRLRAQRTHRAAVLAEVPVEHRPIAEHVLQGDIPAVRQAIDKENEARVARGETPIDGVELIAIAEKLRPSLRTAEWRDKAEAALADVDELDLRDLRSVVVAADAAARDEETRGLAGQLREGLAKRVEAEQATWLGELSDVFDGGRVVRALRLSSRPPKAGTILRPELTAKLTAAASAALTELVAPDRWAVLLDAIAHSPVRLAVKPQSLPKERPAELLEAVRKLSSRIPDIAGQLGVAVTTPPRVGGPRRPPKPPRGSPSRSPEAAPSAEPSPAAAEPVDDAEPVAEAGSGSEPAK